MSATFDILKFFDYFHDVVDTNVKEMSIVSVKEDRKYPLTIHYLNELSKIGQVSFVLQNYFMLVINMFFFYQLPETRIDQPTISKEGFEFCLKLLCVFENIDKIEEKDDIKRPSILIFLPGYSEIEELYVLLNSDVKRYTILYSVNSNFA